VTNGSGGSWVSERRGRAATPTLTTGAPAAAAPATTGLAIPTWQAGFANSSNGASSTVRNLPDVAAEADFRQLRLRLRRMRRKLCRHQLRGAPLGGFPGAGQRAGRQCRPSAGGFSQPGSLCARKSSSYENVFHDVIAGNNYNFKGLAYSAVPGYDLATGLGSPNGQMLIDALSGYSLPDFSLSESPATIMLYPCSSNSMGITVTGHRGFTGSVIPDPSNLPRASPRCSARTPSTPPPRSR